MQIQTISRRSHARLQALTQVREQLATRPGLAPGALAEILGVALMLAVFLTAAIMV